MPLLLTTGLLLTRWPMINAGPQDSVTECLHIPSFWLEREREKKSCWFQLPKGEKSQV